MTTKYVPSPAMGGLENSARIPAVRYPGIKHPDIWFCCSIVMTGVGGFPDWMIVSIPDTKTRRDV